MEEPEEPLTGGNVAAEVVRVGATVRKPATPATPGVEAVLEHLTEVGYQASPRTLGRDDRGRAMEILLIQGHQTGQQPWSRLHAEGHATHWGRAATYIETHHPTWVEALLVTPNPTTDDGA